MSIEDLIYTRMAADAGFGALAADRFYSVERPANAVMPCAVSVRLSGVPAHAMGSDPGNVRATFEITSYADRPAQARALGAAIKASLSRWRDSGSTPVVEDVFLDNDDEDYDPASGQFEFIQDFTVFYKE